MSETRCCPICEVVKPLSEFPLKGRTRHGDKRYGYCKPCHGKYQRKDKLMREFGMTEDDYDVLLAAQDGRCAICGRLPTKNRLAVDHDHMTGRLRGLLCVSCNGGLGRWGEDIARFAAAIEYLKNPPATEALGERYGRRDPGITVEWLHAAARYLEREQERAA